MSVQVEVETSEKSKTEMKSPDIFSVIRNRRAVREYTSEKVSDEAIRSLLDFTVQAPSAMNLQPWSFVIIQDTKLLREISDKVKKRLSSHPDFLKESEEYKLQFLNEGDFDIFYHAPTLIVICAKATGDDIYNSENDCYLAGENLMLAATGMGLATCPIGLATEVLCEPSMLKRLNIPAGHEPVLPIVVGYSGAKTPSVGRHSPIVKWIR